MANCSGLDLQGTAGVLQQGFPEFRPPCFGATSGGQVSSRQTGGGKVFSVNNHQFLALRVEVDKAQP
jgi:hypothetical protein